MNVSSKPSTCSSTSRVKADARHGARAARVASRSCPYGHGLAAKYLAVVPGVVYAACDFSMHEPALGLSSAGNVKLYGSTLRDLMQASGDQSIVQRGA
ncbi:hypothetical protein HaLaN_00148 [Haematococcus lacustris]|uniref:Uncharacterized protein n=1 Tax=Haematococcus lacustris TaxID=44745 RepID=A0A699YI90_HAELA|nr:hypothetical protein HaLaN_00148 [Haematococcus lacustris]